MSGRLTNYLANEGSKLIVSVLWLGINAAMFYLTFFYYYNGPQFYYLHKMLGYGLCISRATAACINLNACLILLPMCRNTLSILRSYPSTHRVFRRLLDKSKSFHIASGYMLCLMAVLHCGAHFFNAFNFSKHFNSIYIDVNVAAYANQNPIILIVTSVPGITGIAMLTVLIVMTYYSTSATRRGNYRRFWKIHHLFLAFYVLLLFHACSGVLKYQINISEHIPGCFNDDQNGTVIVMEPEPEPVDRNIESPRDGVVVPELQSVPESEPYHKLIRPEPSSVNYIPCEQPEPKFRSCSTEAWRWLLIPLMLYAAERTLRLFGKSISVTKVVEHPRNVLEIEFFNTTIKAKPGQSIWIRCPSISASESHPFTVTSVPTKGNPYFTIHMAVTGEWTNKVKECLITEFQGADDAKNVPDTCCLIYKDKIICDVSDSASALNSHYIVEGRLARKQSKVPALRPCESIGDEAEQDSDESNLKQPETPQFYAVGPYSSPLQDIFRYPVAVCVAGGIGITPYAAVLNMIRCGCDVLSGSSKLQRIYLIWICRHVESFDWFIDLINSVQKQLWSCNKPDFLNVYLHVTSDKFQGGNMVHTIYPKLNQCRVDTKRPNFKNFFDHIAERHKRTKVGVFCCGPKSLNHAVRRQCVNTKSATEVKFIFNSESF